MRLKSKSKSKPKSKRSSNPKSKSQSRSKSLALFEDNVGCEEHAMPLDFVPSRRSACSKKLLELTPRSGAAGKTVGRKMQEEQTCLRRSPRLSPLPDMPPPIMKARGSLGNAALDAKCVRRSPRLASSDVEAESSGSYVQHKSLYEKHTRRSPRFSTSVVAVCNISYNFTGMSHSEERYDSKKILIDKLDEKNRRRSPRFSPHVAAADSRLQHKSIGFSDPNGKCHFKKNISDNYNIKFVDGKCSKHSPKRAASVFDVQKREAKCALIELTAPETREIECTFIGLSETSAKQPRQLMEKLDEKHLRSSPGLSPSVAAAESRLHCKSVRVSDSNPFKKNTVPLRKYYLRDFDGKCSKHSPKRVASLFEAERIEAECALIEFPDSENRKIECALLPETSVKQPQKKLKTVGPSNGRKKKCETSCFIGDLIPDVEARKRWGWRYQLKSQRSKRQSMKLNDDEEDEIILNVECHFAQAKVGNCIFSIGDCVFVKGNEGKKDVGRILEFFKTTDGENYFRVQWFYRVEDTVIKEVGSCHDKRRLFFSTIMNDNLIDCIISKVQVTQICPRVGSKVKSFLPSDFYYDMEYCVDYSTFRTMVTDDSFQSHSFSSTTLTETVPTLQTEFCLENGPCSDAYNAELALLDLYCGCGGMSTGLCLGAKLSRVNLVTKWAIDHNKSAIESLKLNHPETHVRNEAAEDFLELLKEWEKLCREYEVNIVNRTYPSRSRITTPPKYDDEIDPGELEVSKIVDICYGDPNKTGDRGLYFKVRWKGYGSSDDTWEPIGGLSNCEESIQDFVRDGRRLKILPLPGDADVICGGPPCQGISGYNRYRNVDSPLDDERNRQIIVFMDIVNFLTPKYVLMENVGDILRFDSASLGRYALSRLVQMNYQARLGIIAAGCYGLPQFRLRVFLWGAHPYENLPQFPRPTHDVIIRYWPPPEFERNVVAYDEGQPRELHRALVLKDAISDLPAVTHNETSEEMSFENPPETDFQRYIRSTKYEMVGSVDDNITTENLLYDHRSYPLNEDDYVRICQIPKRKGANFRDLPGVVVGKDNVARRDPTVKDSDLPSGKPLVPDYAFTFEQGKSKRPFARLWWDETMPTVVTYPSCHNQAVLHPEQDRILTLRECARLQGFPDYYRFCGTVKQRYCQVGNAVAVPVARALGYALGLAVRNCSGNEPLLTLPHKFPHSNYIQFTQVLPVETE